MINEDESIVAALEDMDRYVSLIQDAVSSDDIDEMRRYTGEAMPVAQNVMDSLEEALMDATDPEMVDRIEDAMHHLGMSLDAGDQIFEANEETIEEYVAEMQRHAEMAANMLGVPK